MITQFLTAPGIHFLIGEKWLKDSCVSLCLHSFVCVCVCVFMGSCVSLFFTESQVMWWFFCGLPACCGCVVKSCIFVVPLTQHESVVHAESQRCVVGILWFVWIICWIQMKLDTVFYTVRPRVPDGVKLCLLSTNDVYWYWAESVLLPDSHNCKIGLCPGNASGQNKSCSQIADAQRSEKCIYSRCHSVIQQFIHCSRNVCSTQEIRC